MASDQRAGGRGEDDERVIEQFLLREFRDDGSHLGVEGGDRGGGAAQVGQQVAAEHFLVARNIGCSGDLLQRLEAGGGVPVQELFAAGIGRGKAGERERQKERLRGRLRVDELRRGRSVVRRLRRVSSAGEQLVQRRWIAAHFATEQRRT